MKFKKPNLRIMLFLMIFGFSLIYSIDEGFSITYLDRDNDGVIDEFDECPQASETYNNFQDLDGCPDSISEDKTPYQFPDFDGDGIEDRLDSCPYLPETLNGYLDSDGCPEIVPNQSEVVKDSDFDSIADSIDACPFEKEVFNGFKDGDGCPDSWILPIDDSSKDSIIIDNECRSGLVLVLRINANDSICISSETAKRWESYGIAKIIGVPSTEITDDMMAPPSIQEEQIVAPEIILKPDSTEIIQKTDLYFQTRSDKEQRNIGIVVAFFSALSPWDQKLVSELLDDNYVEHNPTMSGNKIGLLEQLDQIFTTLPSDLVKYELKRIYADEDFVITHSYFQAPNQPDASIIDIFKINESRKIIEHWDIIQEIPDSSLNGNTMFYLN